jgi:hypothetical protein
VLDKREEREKSIQKPIKYYNKNPEYASRYQTIRNAPNTVKKRFLLGSCPSKNEDNRKGGGQMREKR